jgi:alpha-ribazole phosphatase
MHQMTTQCWWVRHAPIEHVGSPIGGYIGQSDVAAALPGKASLWLPDREARWFCSPLKRARQTAMWLQKDCDFTVAMETIPALMEQHFGHWEGQPYDDVWKQAEHAHDWSRPWAVRPDGGESFDDVCARLDQWLEQVLITHAGKHLVMVAHAGTIRAALRHALGTTPEQALSYAIDNCSLSHVAYTGKSGTINFVNRPLV